MIGATKDGMLWDGATCESVSLSGEDRQKRDGEAVKRKKRGGLEEEVEPHRKVKQQQLLWKIGLLI